MGVKTGSEKGCVASPIDIFLCKIEVSKFLIKETLQDIGTLHL